ncbi:MAG: histidine triad nucleotide-binding protein [Bifidobacteriaceae bacterium]|nr:histidine triad nucleotide-binding protein [Bifidobacteriaceae bacterium]
MAEETDCLFCKIAEGQVPSTKVYEDDTVYAFKDINPMSEVHVLVIPKKHYPNAAAVAAADPQLLAHIVETAQKIADDQCDGAYHLLFNTGAAAGQTVFHCHAHVLGGRPDPAKLAGALA